MRGARPPPFTISTITYKVVVYAQDERADTLPLILYVLCGYATKIHSVLVHRSLKMIGVAGEKKTKKGFLVLVF